ncbi:Lrp/AsnC family transcriptional regulator [Candidatus Micrarchaeota archaeon]|nr:Lrp/AsnC family transcriptional regulator [Candidatus Micrarchaeota archaeon]
MSTSRLDEKGKKILKGLRFNARISLTQLAKNAGISKETLNYRLRSMEEKGLISRYFPELNVYKMGLTIFRVALKLKNIDEELENRFEEYLSTIPTIWVGYLYGEWDILFGVMVHNPLEFDKYINEIMQKFGQHISEKAIGIQINDFFLDYDYIYGKSLRRNSLQLYDNEACSVITLDSKDKKIIALLYNNARQSYFEISKQLSMSPETVKRRIKALENSGIIKRYLTSINRMPLGYKKYKVLLYVNNFSLKNKKDLLNYCFNTPNITHVTTTTGSWDLEIDYDATTLTEFHTLFRQLRNRFSSQITDYSVLANYKYQYINPFESRFRL